jgi:DTW domain-containing protein YfiP
MSFPLSDTIQFQGALRDLDNRMPDEGEEVPECSVCRLPMNHCVCGREAWNLK